MTTTEDRRILHAGLDGEMSGPRPSAHKLIEIGASFPDLDHFASRIGWVDPPYDPDALAAIGRSADDLNVGPSAASVDGMLADWLVTRGVRRRGLVAVGWGVSSFDLPFIARSLPEVTKLLSHQTVELNAVCWTLDGQVRSSTGRRVGFTELKGRAKDAAAELIEQKTGLSASWHSAGFDAMAAVAAWGWLRELVGYQWVDMSKQIGFA